MAIRFTNNEMLYPGVVPTITATIFRRPTGTSAPAVVYGPVAVYVEELTEGRRAFLNNSYKLSVDNAASHMLLLDYPTLQPGQAAPYTPVERADYVHVTGSRGKTLDGYYALMHYTSPSVYPVQQGGILDHLELLTRYLGVQVLGDQGEDNTGNLFQFE